MRWRLYTQLAWPLHPYLKGTVFTIFMNETQTSPEWQVHQWAHLHVNEMGSKFVVWPRFVENFGTWKPVAPGWGIVCDNGPGLFSKAWKSCPLLERAVKFLRAVPSASSAIGRNTPFLHLGLVFARHGDHRSISSGEMLIYSTDQK
jgi:hypothetical protein